MKIDPIIERFSEHLKLPEIMNFPWMADEYSVTWNEEGNITDLINRDGATYEDDIVRGPFESGDYVLYLLADSFGGNYQAIFNKANQVLSDDQC